MFPLEYRQRRDVGQGMQRSCTHLSHSGGGAALEGRNYVGRHSVVRRPIELPAHAHEPAQIILLLGGEWRDQSEVDHRLHEGDLLLHPPNVRHSVIVAAGSELLHIEFGKAVAELFCPLYGGLPRSLAFRSETFDGVVEQLREELARGPATRPLVVESLLYQMAAIGVRLVSNSTPALPAWLERVTSYIHVHAREHLSNQRLAEVACMSPSALSHAFRDHTGVTLSRYIRDYRVRLAARALRQTSHPIKQIAAATGFYDQAHLCRVFKAVRNLTPAEYRKMRTAHPGVERESR